MLSATPRLNPDDRRERIKLTGELRAHLTRRRDVRLTPAAVAASVRVRSCSHN
ncbi:hypothetical protein ACVXG7_11390 [Enterobacter hormaechei]